MTFVRKQHPGDWSWISDTIIKDYAALIGPSALAVYIQLCHHANAIQECWPSYSTMCHMLGISKPTAIRAINTLIRYGLIEKEDNQHLNGGDAQNTYRLLEPRKLSDEERNDMLCSMITRKQPEEPTPVEPTPVEPTPVEPTPVEPTPVEPAPPPPRSKRSAIEQPVELVEPLHGQATEETGKEEAPEPAQHVTGDAQLSLFADEENDLARTKVQTKEAPKRTRPKKRHSPTTELRKAAETALAELGFRANHKDAEEAMRQLVDLGWTADKLPELLRWATSGYYNSEYYYLKRIATDAIAYTARQERDAKQRLPSVHEMDLDQYEQSPEEREEMQRYIQGMIQRSKKEHDGEWLSPEEIAEVQKQRNEQTRVGIW